MFSLLAIYQRYIRHPWLAGSVLLIESIAVTSSPIVFGYLISVLSGETDAPTVYIWIGALLMVALDALGVCCQYTFQCCMIRETASMARRMKNDVAGSQQSHPKFRCC